MKKESFISKILIAFGIIILYIILEGVTAVVADVYKTNNLLYTCISIAGSILTIVVIAYLLRDKLKGQFKDFNENYKKYLPTAFKWWAIGFTLMFISNLVINILILKGIAPNEDANRELIKLYPFYAITSACVFAPITEELLFRLNFKNIFKKRIPYILFTGLLFGSMHLIASSSLIELIYIIPYGALGIAFGAIFYDTDNIYSSMCMHIFHNTLTILLILSNL